MFNYGMFPRTWEDPEHINPDAGVGGDNDPLDVVEIGMKQILAWNATGPLHNWGSSPLAYVVLPHPGEYILQQ